MGRGHAVIPPRIFHTIIPPHVFRTNRHISCRVQYIARSMRTSTDLPNMTCMNSRTKCLSVAPRRTKQCVHEPMKPPRDQEDMNVRTRKQTASLAAAGRKIVKRSKKKKNHLRRRV